MANIRNELKKAFQNKENAESLRDNLERMRSEKSISEEQYEPLRKEYDARLNNELAEISRMKGEIVIKLESLQGETGAYNQELSNLEVRHKIGELTLGEYQKSENRIRTKIEKIQAIISELETLRASNSSSDFSGAEDRYADMIVGLKKSNISGRTTLTEIFARSFDIYKGNPIIIVPFLLPIGWEIIGVSVILAGILGGMAGGVFFGGSDLMSLIYGGLGLGILAAIIVDIIRLSLFAIAAGWTIVMINDALSGITIDLSRSWNLTKRKILTLIVASILCWAIVNLGLMLLILPGIVLSFLLLFYEQAIMIDDKGAIGSQLSSSGFVRSNLLEAFIIFLGALIIIAIFLSAGSVLGSLMILLAMPFITVLMTLFYLDRRQ